jgi:hypothetical protein
MKEDKDQPRQVSTCLEDSAYAEMMQKIMNEQGIGSLCEERMRSLLNTGRRVKEEPQEAEKEDGRKTKKNNRAGQAREFNKSNQTEE